MASSSPLIATSASHQSSSSAPSALSKFTTRDKLLLAQAVHELGTSPPDWGKVAGLMLAHPLVREPARLEEVHAAGITIGRVFGTRECERAWTALMRQRGLIVDPTEAAALHRSAAAQARNRKEARGAPPRMDKRSMLVLAQLLYAERMEEIKRNIKEKEGMYRDMAAELEDLQTGKLDDRIAAELRGEIAAAPQRKRTLPQTGSTVELSQSSVSPLTSSAKPVQAQKSRASISDVETSPSTSKSKVAEPAQSLASAPTSATTGVPSSESKDKEAKTPTASKGKRRSLGGDETIAVTGRDSSEQAVNKLEKAVAPDTQDEDEDMEPPASEKKLPPSTPVRGRGVGKRKRGGDEEDTKEGIEESEDPSPDVKSARPKSKRVKSDLPIEDSIDQNNEVDDDNNNEEEETPADEESPKKSAVRASSAPRRTRRTTRGAPDEGEADADQPLADGTVTPVRRKSRSRRNISREASTVPDAAEERSGDVDEEEEEQDEEEEEEEDGADRADRDGDSDGDEDNSRSRLTSPASSRAGIEGNTPASSTRSGRVRSAGGRRQRGVSNASSSVQTPASKTRSKRDTAPTRKTRGDVKERDTANTSAESVDRDDKSRRKTSEKVLLMLLQEVANHMHGNLFQGPIKDQDAPGYYTVIRDPWDLRRVKAAVKSGEINSALELHRKLNIMFANALMYNRPGTEMHRMAKEMWQSAEDVSCLRTFPRLLEMVLISQNT